MTAPVFEIPQPRLVQLEDKPPLNLPDEFWTSRRALQVIRDRARRDMAPPDSTFGVVLVHKAYWIPWQVRLPAVIGGPSPINLAVALTAPSGGGKGISTRVGSDIVGPDPDPLSGRVVHEGSGEGLAASFAPPDNDPDGFGPRRVLMDVPEGRALKELISRSGSTLPSQMLKAWSGESLGHNNATAPHKRPVVPAMSYRWCLLMGVQHGIAQELLAQADSGLPQRLIWLSATDPDADADAPPAPPWPVVSEPVWGDLHAVDGRRDMRVAEAIRRAIRAERQAILRCEVVIDPLDGHRTLNRLRVAAVLAWIDGRLDVACDDWDLAGLVMETSANVRGNVAAELAERRAREAEQQTAREVRTAVRKHEAVRAADEGKMRRARSVTDKVLAAGGEMRERDVMQSYNGARRADGQQAVEDAIDRGWLVRDGKVLRAVQ